MSGCSPCDQLSPHLVKWGFQLGWYIVARVSLGHHQRHVSLEGNLLPRTLFSDGWKYNIGHVVKAFLSTHRMSFGVISCKFFQVNPSSSAAITIASGPKCPKLCILCMFDFCSSSGRVKYCIARMWLFDLTTVCGTLWLLEPLDVTLGVLFLYMYCGASLRPTVIPDVKGDRERYSSRSADG
ncbi:unnamed protein product [Absidia cylindrospora]